MSDKIILNMSQLPQVVEVVGNNGERKSYQLKAAGRKFGAFLCQTDEQRESSLSSQPDR